MLRAGLDGVSVGPLIDASDFSFNGVNFSGCGSLSSLAPLVSDMLDDILTRYVQHTASRARAAVFNP